LQNEKTTVESIQEIESGIFLIKIKAPQIALSAKPGQFCNIKVSENNSPLLQTFQHVMLKKILFSSYSISPTHKNFFLKKNAAMN
jgi:NAD(P)H-flavin reductase